MRHSNLTLLLTCEHGGHRVPRPYAPLFATRQAMLSTHRGWDRGALDLARLLAREFDAPLHSVDVTRLLIDNNRSLGHPDLFSAIAQALTPPQRQQVIARHYQPHRDAVTRQIDSLLKQGRRVLHIGVHSFTPVRRGQVRKLDVGLLYDPSRPREKAFCQQWAQALRDLRPRASVRFNAPYRGNADGLTTSLRREFAANRYLGIELEVNQKLVRHRATWRDTQRWIATALDFALAP